MSDLDKPVEVNMRDLDGILRFDKTYLYVDELCAIYTAQNRCFLVWSCGSKFKQFEFVNFTYLPYCLDSDYGKKEIVPFLTESVRAFIDTQKE